MEQGRDPPGTCDPRIRPRSSRGRHYFFSSAPPGGWHRYSTNSLTLGCDCLGTIHYFDAHLCTSRGAPLVIRNAVCLHEEDHGILWPSGRPLGRWGVPSAAIWVVVVSTPFPSARGGVWIVGLVDVGTTQPPTLLCGSLAELGEWGPRTGHLQLARLRLEGWGFLSPPSCPWQSHRSRSPGIRTGGSRWSGLPAPPLPPPGVVPSQIAFHGMCAS